MRCPSCHGEVAGDARFCRHCGTPLHQAPERNESTPTSMDSGATVVDVGPRPTSSSPIDLENGHLFHDRYRIQDKLGQGGMGQVYRAEDQVTGDTVVLKVLRPELLSSEKAIARFRREGALTRSLHHTNIVALYDVNVVDGLTYVTMEYLEGRSLREFMLELRRSGEDLDFDVTRAIIDRILDGLSAAHQAGVIHRDLKPENIMLKGDPRNTGFQLRIVDFGIARALVSDSQLTVAGAALGTEAYMAPEQVTGADVVGPQADLYSVAVILYELLVQVIPRGHWELPTRIRPDLPKALDQVLEHGLNPHPKRRYQSAVEFRDALTQVAEGKSVNKQTDAPNIDGVSLVGTWQSQSTDFLGQPAQITSTLKDDYTFTARIESRGVNFEMQVEGGWKVSGRNTVIYYMEDWRPRQICSFFGCQTVPVPAQLRVPYEGVDNNTLKDVDNNVMLYRLR